MTAWIDCNPERGYVPKAHSYIVQSKGTLQAFALQKTYPHPVCPICTLRVYLEKSGHFRLSSLLSFSEVAMLVFIQWLSHWIVEPIVLAYKNKRKVTILGICALHLTIQDAHTHAVNTQTQWTHTRSSGQPFMLRHPGEQLGVWCLARGHPRLGMDGGERALYIHSSPPATILLPETWTRNLLITSPLGHH